MDSKNYWFEPNIQQDHGLMDHEVSSPGYIGFMGNGSSMPDVYRPNITQESCEMLHYNETLKLLKTHPDGFCNASFDNILCWPPTLFEAVAKMKCFSEFLGIRYDDTQNATRNCSLNGTWSKSVYDDCKEIYPFPSTFETLTNIYLIGYIISSVTLAIAIFIFTYFKELRCLRNKIHMNLLWSYLLTYCMWIVVLIELNFREHMAVTCVFVVTLLHYFNITTFFWMFVEGLYLYILVVRTLTRESFKLRVYVLIGWGTPLFFIIIWAVCKSLLLDASSNEQSDACSWFSFSYIDYIFQIPTIIVLIVNIIFMVSIMVVLVTKLRSANTLEIQQYRKAVKALAVLIPLLGVTYAITIYAPSFSVWDMFRSALLSVQGFMVALFYCFLNTEVQNTLKHHFENWKTKKSLGPSRLRSSSRSKDWSPRSRTESLRITEWTLVGTEDIEDNEKRMAHLKAKEMYLCTHRKEPMCSQPLLTNQSPRKLNPDSTNLKFSNETMVSTKDGSYLNPPLLAQRKKSLVNQPLFEQSEDSSPTDQHSESTTPPPVSVTNALSPTPRDSTVVINNRGEPSVTIPNNRSNALLRK
ncbi:diuretic hormone receptor-like isoform X2 [Euwallacea fornicatus]|uniref:diuretic hormone receptor-like isoform X2 n=1 Tax=Euwallacea fornicatus TaxID=995702 RepID=UPI00338E3C8A